MGSRWCHHTPHTHTPSRPPQTYKLTTTTPPPPVPVPVEGQRAKLLEELEAAEAAVGASLVQRREQLSEEALLQALARVRCAVEAAFPGGLPAWEPVAQALNTDAQACEVRLLPVFAATRSACAWLGGWLPADTRCAE